MDDFDPLVLDFKKIAVEHKFDQEEVEFIAEISMCGAKLVEVASNNLKEFREFYNGILLESLPFLEFVFEVSNFHAMNSHHSILKHQLKAATTLHLECNNKGNLPPDIKQLKELDKSLY